MQYIRSKIPYYERKFNVTNLKVRPSPTGRKRFMATYQLNGKTYIRHFGQQQAVTYADGADRTKRLAFQARHSKIKDKKGRMVYMVPGSSSSLSYWLLW